MSKHIHPLSDVQSTHIGDNTFVWQFSVVLGNAVIGANCNINCNCFIENDVVIGDNVTIKSGVQVWDGITIENDVFVGPNVTFTNDLMPRSKVRKKNFERTVVKNNVSIGANATIIAGTILNEYAFIGAGSVVTKSIPSYTVWYGNPATHKGYITKDGIILDMKLFDKKNNQAYRLDENSNPIKND